MAIFHLQAKVIQRSKGRSVIAAAAYRAGEALFDAELGRTQNFLAKPGVVHAEVLLPAGAPARWLDRETLWNEVAAHERRKDAVLAREIELALPRELSQAEAIALARDFVAEQFVGRGMVADLTVHWGTASDGGEQPHAHVLLTMRRVDPAARPAPVAGSGQPEKEEPGWQPAESESGGFGLKERGWNDKALLRAWRARWAELVNERLALAGHDATVDHRSHAARGIDLEPVNKIGPAGARRAVRGEDAERAAEHRAIARRNGARLLAEPGLALEALTRQQSTFTRADLARLVHRHSDGASQFAAILAAVEASPDLVWVGTDGRGRDRYSTRAMVAIERDMVRSAAALAGRTTHRVHDRRRLAGLEARLSAEQRAAYLHVTRARDLAAIVGVAGGGKSTLLGAARATWEAQGYRVRGAALAGIAAEALQASAGIESRTIASWEHAWGEGRERLGRKDVFVLDEAGMVGSRQMARVLAAARAAGAKLVLVGDAEQLQAIEAGAAFRAVAERAGAIAITEPRRQLVDWQRTATKELATARTDLALNRYGAAGMVHAHDTRNAARAAVIAGWHAARRAAPARTQLILAHERADARALNEAARAMRRDAGELGPDHAVMTELGERTFAVGDRIAFLRNERGLGGTGVRNGTLGTVAAIDGVGECARLTVRLDAGGSVAFALADYAHLDHGYAATIHRNQGATVDTAHVLATPGMDRHLTYVAMSRHRHAAHLHWSAEDFGDAARMRAALGRERAKDTTLDYDDPVTGYAARRGIDPLRPEREIVVAPGMKEGIRKEEVQGYGPIDPRLLEGLEPTRKRPRDPIVPPDDPPSPEVPGATVPSVAGETLANSALHSPGRFDGLRLAVGPVQAPADPLPRALIAYLEAIDAARDMRDRGLPVLPHQRDAIVGRRDALGVLRPGFHATLLAATERAPALLAWRAPGGIGRIIDAVDREPARQATERDAAEEAARARAEEQALAPLRERLLDERMRLWWRDTYPYARITDHSFDARDAESRRVRADMAETLRTVPVAELRGHERRWQQEDAEAAARPSFSPSPW